MPYAYEGAERTKSSGELDVAGRALYTQVGNRLASATGTDDKTNLAVEGMRRAMQKMVNPNGPDDDLPIGIRYPSKDKSGPLVSTVYVRVAGEELRVVAREYPDKRVTLSSYKVTETSRNLGRTVEAWQWDEHIGMVELTNVGTAGTLMKLSTASEGIDISGKRREPTDEVQATLLKKLELLRPEPADPGTRRLGLFSRMEAERIETHVKVIEAMIEAIEQNRFDTQFTGWGMSRQMARDLCDELRAIATKRDTMHFAKQNQKGDEFTTEVKDSGYTFVISESRATKTATLIVYKGSSSDATLDNTELILRFRPEDRTGEVVKKSIKSSLFDRMIPVTSSTPAVPVML